MPTRCSFAEKRLLTLAARSAGVFDDVHLATVIPADSLIDHLAGVQVELYGHSAGIVLEVNRPVIAIHLAEMKTGIGRVFFPRPFTALLEIADDAAVTPAVVDAARDPAVDFRG